jgi:hypothetical protein
MQRTPSRSIDRACPILQSKCLPEKATGPYLLATRLRGGILLYAARTLSGWSFHGSNAFRDQPAGLFFAERETILIPE